MQQQNFVTQLELEIDSALSQTLVIQVIILTISATLDPNLKNIFCMTPGSIWG
jgi:hypothetical protein